MNSNIRLYFSNKIKSGVISKLPKNQSHYVKNVIRLKAGQQFSVFNSDGEWKALILLHTKDYTEFKVLEKLRHQEEQQEIYLAFSPIKKIAQDIMLQKTTELGVKKFFPILCERSVVREINIDRSKKILIEASEQSNRISIPDISKIMNLETFLKNFSQEGKIIFCDINSKSKDFKNVMSIKGSKCILIGPEGDFSEKERQSIVDNKNTVPISLAKNILRAETAAIAATTLLTFNL